MNREAFDGAVVKDTFAVGVVADRRHQLRSRLPADPELGVEAAVDKGALAVDQPGQPAFGTLDPPQRLGNPHRIGRQRGDAHAGRRAQRNVDGDGQFAAHPAEKQVGDVGPPGFDGRFDRSHRGAWRQGGAERPPGRQQPVAVAIGQGDVITGPLMIILGHPIERLQRRGQRRHPGEHGQGGDLLAQLRGHRLGAGVGEAAGVVLGVLKQFL